MSRTDGYDKMSSDFNPAKDMEDYLFSYVFNGKGDKSSETEHHCGCLKDGREIELFFPNGTDALRHNLLNNGSLMDRPQKTPSQLYFVLFVGYKKSSSPIDQKVVDMSWEITAELRRDLSKIEEILAFAMCERSLKGDWTNLILFNDQKALDKWREVRIHKRATVELSPKLYSQVRIHRGRLTGKFRDGAYEVTRTLFLDYETNDEQSKRKEIYWD